MNLQEYRYPPEHCFSLRFIEFLGQYEKKNSDSSAYIGVEEPQLGYSESGNQLIISLVHLSEKMR